MVGTFFEGGLQIRLDAKIKIYAPHHKAWQVLFGKNVYPYRESPFVLGRKTADTESNCSALYLNTEI